MDLSEKRYLADPSTIRRERLKTEEQGEEEPEDGGIGRGLGEGSKTFVSHLYENIKIPDPVKNALDRLEAWGSDKVASFVSGRLAKIDAEHGSIQSRAEEYRAGAERSAQDLKAVEENLRALGMEERTRETLQGITQDQAQYESLHAATLAEAAAKGEEVNEVRSRYEAWKDRAAEAKARVDQRLEQKQDGHSEEIRKLRESRERLESGIQENRTKAKELAVQKKPILELMANSRGHAKKAYEDMVSQIEKKEGELGELLERQKAELASQKIQSQQAREKNLALEKKKIGSRENRVMTNEGRSREAKPGDKEKREEWESFLQEARERRDGMLEKDLFHMGKKDFRKYFIADGTEREVALEQKNVGNCYALAALYALSASPNFELMVRSSMTRLSDGSWEVRLPLLSQPGEGSLLRIRPADMAAQDNPQYGLEIRERGKDTGGKDGREKLLPVNGKEGLRALEAALIKNRFKRTDGVGRLQAEGGLGGEALLELAGENFVQYQVVSEVYDTEKEQFAHPGLQSLGAEDMFFLDEYLGNFDSETHVATVATRGAEALKQQGGKASEIFHAKHAYAVKSVDKKNKIIHLVNPHDTTRGISLPFSQFKETFSSLQGVRIHNARLLKNIKALQGI